MREISREFFLSISLRRINPALLLIPSTHWGSDLFQEGTTTVIGNHSLSWRIFSWGFLSRTFSIPPYYSPYRLPLICVSPVVNQVVPEQLCSWDSAWSSPGQRALAWLAGTAAASSLNRSSARVTSVYLFSLFLPPPSSPRLQMSVCVQLREKHLAQFHKNKCQPATKLSWQF